MTIDNPNRILRLPAVLALTGLSRATLYRKLDRGAFPKRVQISQRCVGWRAGAIEDWLNNPMFYDVDEHRQSTG